MPSWRLPHTSHSRVPHLAHASYSESGQTVADGRSSHARAVTPWMPTRRLPAEKGSPEAKAGKRQQCQKLWRHRQAPENPGGFCLPVSGHLRRFCSHLLSSGTSATFHELQSVCPSALHCSSPTLYYSQLRIRIRLQSGEAMVKQRRSVL
jgi:hypothetical protein